MNTVRLVLTRIVSVLTATILSAASTAEAQQPLLTNARVESRAVTAGLEKEVGALLARASEPAWIGYAVPALEGDRSMCCWSGDGGGAGRSGCRLEPGSANAVTMTSTPDRAVPLEAGESFFVLYRVEQGQVSRIRMFSEDCPLDGGGRAVHWLTGVRPPESIDFLTTFTGATATNKIADSALSALAMHRDPAAIDRLVTAARDGATTHLRGQALFWLAQRAGEKAVGAISDAIARDPETEVKRRAVFALSQLPKDQGVPLLIQVARTNTNPSVRKQAIFWLGQSKDARALKFFEEILFK
jgi:hypothetical protein